MEIQILKFLSSLVGHCHAWQRGDVVEVPSPAIEGRTDIVLVMFPRAEVPVSDDDESVELYNGAGFIVRNKGKYSAAKSKKIAAALSLLLAECEPAPYGSVNAYDNSSGMIGETDPAAHWVDFLEYPTAPIKLAKLQSASTPVKTIKVKKPSKKPSKKRGKR